MIRQGLLLQCEDNADRAASIEPWD
ncbi:hypothetical protein CBM2633_A70425 [Cupriavidus taiwanensis]|uniref:Uncharacterized protein n=1 Tax=Cupriavidus taiwanensis TaxID=164546 RepID=A0A375E040_9BURK|nr:hypothetical protein CBM2604_A90030 [Cupriavidus taiwanensis]SOZ23469.1 hypothetical protein CBM2609_A110031 [Cupriavidus taiwanensis]SOZ43844.1 hypothetical protein CBM2610_A110030 [Cupriavidus taiwanensis]SOZ52765.1 hypothetical protein CBM2615_A240349 [Cupriavidus taiwanensis]SOZ54264.1 hypothetical protein CBM2614_A210351 [Cupriavidus taiwanensis]